MIRQPTETVAEIRTARRKRAIENLMAKNLNRGTPATHLTPMKVISMKTATIRITGRGVESMAAEQKTTDEYPDGRGIPTSTAGQKSRPPRYWNLQSSRVLEITPIWTTTKVAKAGGGANFK